MTTTAPTAVDRLLDVVTAARSTGGDVYAAEAHLDAVVPGWRFSVRGAERIDGQLAQWFAHPGRLEELERQRTPTGEVLMYTVTWEEGGVPHAARHAHVLTIVDDRITHDRFWCGGRWPAPLLADMEEAGVR